jgi:hypothetical protein
MAGDGALRQRDIGHVDVMQFAARSDDAGTRDVDQDTAGLRGAACNSRNLVDVVGAARPGIDPGGHTVLQAHRRTVLAEAGMGVNVDQTRRDNLAMRVDRLGGIARDIFRNRNDLAA